MKQETPLARIVIEGREQKTRSEASSTVEEVSSFLWPPLTMNRVTLGKFTIMLNVL